MSHIAAGGVTIRSAVPLSVVTMCGFCFVVFLGVVVLFFGVGVLAVGVGWILCFYGLGDFFSVCFDGCG